MDDDALAKVSGLIRIQVLGEIIRSLTKQVIGELEALDNRVAGLPAMIEEYKRRQREIERIFGP